MSTNGDRLHARGMRGEACIVMRAQRKSSSQGDVDDSPCSYKLATGERLNPTSDPNVLETLDGKRRFTLAQGQAR